MNLFSWIRIQAESMIKDRKTRLSRKLDPTLQIHYKHVADAVNSIKKSGDIIQMTNQAQPVGNDDSDDKSWQTVLYHGLTRSAEKKTFIRTMPDGTLQKWVEPVA